MCLLILSIPEPGTNAPLVLAMNRDEAFIRRTLPLHRWDRSPEEVALGILGGRDLEAGGTWFAVSQAGRFAALTNYFGHEKINPPTRGTLVPEFLSSKLSTEAYLSSVLERAAVMSGFHLVVGEHTGSGWNIRYTNNVEREIREIPPGLHGIANQSINSEWARIEGAKTLWRTQVTTVDSEEIRDAAFSVLRHDDEVALDRPIPVDRDFRSPFARSNGTFGTRTAAVCTITADQLVQIEERTFNEREETVNSVTGFIRSAHQPVVLPTGALPLDLARARSRSV